MGVSQRVKTSDPLTILISARPVSTHHLDHLSRLPEVSTATHWGMANLHRKLAASEGGCIIYGGEGGGGHCNGLGFVPQEWKSSVHGIAYLLP